MRYEIASHGLGEEAVELGRSCGAEKLALERSILGKTLPGIPHEDYRMLVTAATLRRAGARGAAPTTLDHAKAKAAVDAALVARGIGIVIPSAQPGRVTR